MRRNDNPSSKGALRTATIVIGIFFSFLVFGLQAQINVPEYNKLMWEMEDPEAKVTEVPEKVEKRIGSDPLSIF